jgi:hypothetical protein
MYEIGSATVISFIEDQTVRLPRFQRKQTWDDKRNFELCISVFKEFPLGVCILNVDTASNGRTTKWLLDGRQRHNALQLLWDDPENVYVWARKWIGIKVSDQPADVADKFWDKVRDYLENEEDDTSSDEVEEAGEGGADDANESEVEALEVANDEGGEEELEGVTIDLSKKRLEFLLEIVTLIHNKTPKYSGFTRPFDFAKQIKNLPYVVTSITGKVSLSGKKLKTFISEYQQWCRNEGLESESQSSFKEFLKSRYPLDGASQTKLEQRVADNWESIKARIELLDKVKGILQSSKIALIELRAIKATDSQKIFNIINSKGTKLTAVEILSAKPSWNRTIENPGAAQVQAKNDLYNRIGIKHDNVVKWDLPATLLPRLQNVSSLFDIGGDTKTAIEKQLTLGFKLLSGIYQSGVRKEDIDELSKNSTINWELDFEELLNSLNSFVQFIFGTEYFKFFKSWRRSLMGITSDAIALNFVLVLFADWKRKGRPMVNGTELRVFQKNAFILIDQLIYEYVTRQWRGSSDSRIAGNLTKVSQLPSLFPHLPGSKWKELLNEIFDSNLVVGETITQRIMEPLLYHFYAMKKLAGPDSDSIEVDHIVPQTLFKSSAYSEDESLPHNLFNLGLLPKRDNISKSDKALIQVSDAWLKHQIVKYQFVEEVDFGKYSNISNLGQLKQLRRPIFEAVYGEVREDILNN